MRKHSTIRHLVALLSVFAVATFLWGCGQTAPTGVDYREASLTTATGGNPPPADNGGTTDENNGWW